MKTYTHGKKGRVLRLGDILVTIFILLPVLIFSVLAVIASLVSLARALRRR